MKITEIRAFYPRYQHLAPSWRTHLWQIVVRVEAGAGRVGWGFGGGGRAAVEVVNGHFRDLLVGRSVSGPEEISGLWDELYRASAPYGRRGLGIMALSGVDLALWDLVARAENKRVCDLLGGLRRERVPAYASGLDVEWYRDLGFRAHKASHQCQGAGTDQERMDRIAAWAHRARQALGPEALLMADAYMTWSADFARQLARTLAPFRLHWFEDVLLPDELEELAALRPQLKPILLAGGEHEFTEYGFAELARTRALDVWQPDLTWCGGLSAAQRIVALASRCGVKVVLHRGGEIWGLHLIASGACEGLAELVMGQRQADRDRVWLGEPEPVEGYLELPEGVGFGVRVNEEIL